MTDALSEGNAEQVDYWNGAAGERWALLQTRIDGLFAPLTAASLAFAAPQVAATVLDVGCGAGATVLALARTVGPDGRVLGVDVSRPMLAVAQLRVASEGIANATLLLADASAHPFEPETADLVFSRFGVMFFADPVAAFANIRTALKPAGRLAFACWQPLSANSWFAVPLDALRPLLPPSPPTDPFAPGPLAFADPDRVRRILGSAGFTDVVIEPHVTSLQLGDRSAALDFLTQVGPAARAIGEASSAERLSLRQALDTELAAHEGPDGVVLGGAIWLVSAQRG